MSLRFLLNNQHIQEKTMLILNKDDVRKALPMSQAIEATKKAYASLSEGTAVVPLRTHLSIPNSDAISLFMPAYVYSADSKALAIKARLIRNFSNNLWFLISIIKASCCFQDWILK